MPSTDVNRTGTVLHSSYSKSPPIFLPIKTTGETKPFAIPVAVPGEKIYVPPSKSIFAGRLYEAADWVHQGGVTPEQLLHNSRRDIDAGGSKYTKDQIEIDRILRCAKDSCSVDGVVFPPVLCRYWARKTNKSWMNPSKEVAEEIIRMYEQGKGFKNHAIR